MVGGEDVQSAMAAAEAAVAMSQNSLKMWGMGDDTLLEGPAYVGAAAEMAGKLMIQAQLNGRSATAQSRFPLQAAKEDKAHFKNFVEAGR